MTARTDLDKQSREDLIARARRLGVTRPEVMTRVELADEIIRCEETDATARRRARGWLGVARDLVASLIEDGLNMPDAAALVRQGVTPTRIVHQPPVATVTLAEIYSTQGHTERALKMLDEVLDKEPDHAAARALRDRLAAQKDEGAPPESAPAEALESVPPEPVSSGSPASEPTLASAVDNFVPAVNGAESQPEPEPEATPEPQPEPEVTPEPQPEPEVTPEPQPEPEATPEPQPEPLPAPGFEPLEIGLSAEPVRGPITPPIAPQVDAVIAMRVSKTSLYVYWELTAATEGQARAHAPSGHAVVKLVAYRPGIGIADRIEREIDAPLPSGAALVHGLGRGSIVRVALGWKTSDGVRALVVGTEIEKSNGETPRVRYAPIGSRRTTQIEEAERRALENLSRAQI